MKFVKFLLLFSIIILSIISEAQLKRALSNKRNKASTEEEIGTTGTSAQELSFRQTVRHLLELKE
jgi:hypothetical protein